MWTDTHRDVGCVPILLHSYTLLDLVSYINSVLSRSNIREDITNLFNQGSRAKATEFRRKSYSCESLS